ncbi:gram positive anchor [Streptococcus oralis SK313]|uniref:Gram positive anchor n=1 Tax=Streptococcus oralis SK313 TaxID=1035190 RepID=F9Q360_STROR|nr:gram positive anchor [Streptococcus oralis SK313]
MSKSKALNMLSKFSALAFAILGLASVLIGIVKADNPVSKELTQVITGIDLLDASDTKQNVSSEGDFSLRTNLAYKLRVTFDLKQYNENLNNGDYFTFDIPAPMTVYNGNQELIDPVTQVAIGEAVVTSNGNDQGGKAKITLKNLDKYLAKTGGDKVKDVSGNFSASFRFLKDQNKTPINFNSSSMKQEIKHVYSSKTISGPKVGTENYAKAGGQASRDNWTSEKLAAIGSVSKGDAVSNWRVRVNTEKQDFGQNIVLHDTIPNDDTSYTPAQYIPETLRVYRADITGGTSAVPDDAVLLSEGKDYTVSWNENYTSFDITFKDGTTSYFVTYSTTTPNDGTKVANIAALSLADGTKLAQNTSRPGALSMKAEATSLISGTIVASTAYQIKINKTDAFTLAPVPGAVYTVTATDDASETTEVTTNEKGVALTKTYDQKWEGKTFKIKEKTAPAGYKLDEKEYTVKLGAAGSTINLKDEPVPAVFNVTAKKVVEGRTDKLPKADEFTFNLYTAENLKTPVATAKSKADGTITFENIELKGAGTYRYIIKEDTSNAIDGITFDEEGKEVTVTAAFQGGVLKASVTSAEPTFTNTYKAASTDATIKATKKITGKELVADAYTFELKEKDAVVATAKNTASGEVVFKVDYTEAGEHTYTITEKEGSEKGVTYSTESYTVKVNVVDNGQGQLVATVENAEAERVFTNTYKAASTSATIKAKKVLNGKDLVADAYTFELKEKDAVVATAKNTASGEVVFNVNYTEAGEHTYTITEKAGTEAGVTYSTESYTVKVNVVDNGQGQLVATVENAEAERVFTNTYKATSTSATIKATKKITGNKELVADAYTFELKEKDVVVATAKNNASGKVVFKVNYTEAGEHTYTITEVKGDEKGVTYSTESYTVEVNVVDNGQGQLVATVENADAERVFTNIYTAPVPKATSATLEFTKELTGRALVDGEFQFELYEGTKLVDTKTNQAGKVTFKAINYDAEGVHTYTVKEVNAGATGITYDTEKTAVVTVTKDAATNALKATAEYPAGSVFTNSFKAPAPTATSATLEFTKELTGRALVDGEFRFELYKDGQKIDTKTNQAGKVTFKAINYDAEGVHTYTVKEVNAGATGITYDTEKTAVVTVTKDAATNALKATVEYPAGNVFKNSFKAPAVEATIEATKKLEGKELAADAYTFELKEKGAVVATAKNTAEGKVAFVRSFEEAGTHTYTLVEKVGTEEGVEYDKTEHTVTVTVVADDQGLLTAKVSYADGKEVVFTNKYTVPTPTPEPNPNPAPNNPGTTPDPAPTPDPNPTPDPDPNKPGEKEEPKPTPPATETKGKAELPNTGEATSILSAIGFVVLALSGLVFFVKRKA